MWAVICGLGAGAFWGLSFLLPKVISNVYPEWVAFGRFTFFGIASFLILLIHSKHQNIFKIFKNYFIPAMILSMTGYSLYYVFLVASIQKIGVVLPTLVMGLLPLTTVLVGRHSEVQKIPIKNLVWPLLMLFLGIVFVPISQLNVSHNQYTKKDLVLGLILVLVLMCLASWTYYAIKNSQEIKKNRIDTVTWTCLTGIAALISSVIILPLSGYIQGRDVFESFNNLYNNDQFHLWIIVSFVLGICSSWLAIWMWNYASKHLSAQITGQLIVSETVFGILYSFLYEKRFPHVVELLSITMCIAGVIWGLKVYFKFAKNKTTYFE